MPKTLNFNQLSVLPKAIINTIDEKMKNHIKDGIDRTRYMMQEPKKVIDIMNSNQKDDEFVLQIVAAILETPAGKTLNLLKTTSDGKMTFNPEIGQEGLVESLMVSVDDLYTDPNNGIINIKIGASDNDNNADKIGRAIRAILTGGAINRDGTEIIDRKTITPNTQVIKEIGKKLTTYFVNDIVAKDDKLQQKIMEALEKE